MGFLDAGRLAAKRPLLLEIGDSRDVAVRDVALLDGPRFHLYLGSFCERVLVERVAILVAWEAQAAFARDGMFPFNTDGIDAPGRAVPRRPPGKGRCDT